MTKILSLVFFPFSSLAPWPMDVPGQDSAPSHRCNLQRSANARSRSLTHRAGPGIEHVSQRCSNWILLCQSGNSKIFFIPRNIWQISQLVLDIYFSGIFFGQSIIHPTHIEWQLHARLCARVEGYKAEKITASILNNLLADI